MGSACRAPSARRLGIASRRSTRRYDGNVENRFSGENVNGRESTTVNGKLVWNPSESFTATLAANYIDGETTVGRPFVRLDPNALLRNDPTLPNSVTLPGVVADADNTDISNNFDAGTDYTGNGGSLKLEIGLPAALTLVSISSYDNFELNDLLDQDDTSAPTLSNTQVGVFESKQLTQEIRLLSSDDQPLRYTLGLYYGDTQLDRDFRRGPVLRAGALGRQFRFHTEGDLRPGGLGIRRRAPRSPLEYAIRRKTSNTPSSTSRTRTPSSRETPTTNSKPIVSVCSISSPTTSWPTQRSPRVTKGRPST